VEQRSWSRRTFLRRTLTGVGGVALAGAGAGALGGCTKTGQGDALERARESGTIALGIANEVPFAYMNGTEVTGQAPELARVIFENMGIPNVEARTVPFGALPDQLRNETFDVISAGMFIYHQRCEVVLFSDPDYIAPTAFLIRKGSAAEGVQSFTDIADNPEIKLGTMGKIAEYNAAVGQGVPENQINPGFTNQADAIEALSLGRYDALALTRMSLQVALEADPNPNHTLTEPFYPQVDGRDWVQGGGFGFRYADRDLRDAFNAELHKLQEADDVYPIVKPFGFLPQGVRGAEQYTAADLCRIDGETGKPVE
jgi:polar amino acid transport system substrate-binding protein